MDTSKMPAEDAGGTKLSSQNIQVEYEKLSQQLTQLREDKEQIKYETKRKMEIFEANEKSLTDEIEYWKGEHEKIKKQLQSQSSQFEEERIHMQNVHANETSTLSEELLKYELENVKLMKELKDIQDKTIVENSDLEHIQELEAEILNLKEQLNECTVEVNRCEKTSSELLDRNMALIQENEEYKLCLNSKRAEVRKSNELITELQDEMTVLKRELDILQSQPRDINAKGNSLFAEVYDSRNQIKAKFLDLVDKYQRVLKEKDGLLNEIDILRKETASLREIFNNDMKNFRPGNMFESSGDSDSMSAMRTLLESYKEEIDRIKAEEPPAEREFQYYEAVIERQKKELEKLRGTLSDHTLTHSLRARKVSELGVTVAFWKSRASEAESEKRFLNLKVQDLENKLSDLIQSQNEKSKEKKKNTNPKTIKSERSQAKTPERPKEKSLLELLGNKITFISNEEVKALMENKPYPAKESETTNAFNHENKENENIQTKDVEKEENSLKEESTNSKEHILESSNDSENTNVPIEEKKKKKTIQFSENTKKEDGEGHKRRGTNRYVFNLQVKKLD